jgi:C1A family cysteine protease
MKTFTKTVKPVNPQHVYNLKKQKADKRDFQLKIEKLVAIPPIVDLRQYCPFVFDQGNLGSCTANAGVAARMMLDKLNILLSRLFQYYNERKIEGDIGQDNGAQMRDIGKAIQKYGICLDSIWSYKITKFAKTPSVNAYKTATDYKIGSYYAIPDLNGIKQFIATNQQPVLIGIDVYSSFESSSVAKTGIIPMPKRNEAKLGGHAIIAVGYDDTKSQVICRNSWGISWGDYGYFYLPYAYFANGYAYDFWVLQK